MRAKIPELRQAILNDEATFKRVYLFTYAFLRPSGQKSLPLETAIDYWKLLLGRRWKGHIYSWIEFLEKEYKKSIAKDTWNMLYEFVGLCNIDPELKGYDEEGMWCAEILVAMRLGITRRGYCCAVLTIASQEPGHQF